MLTFIAAVSLALIGSFLCSIMESVLLSVSAADVEALIRNGKRSGRLMKGFKCSIDVPIAAILIVNTVAHTVGASVAGASYASAFNSETLWLFTAVFTAAILLFTEIIPKTLGVSHARELASFVAYSIQILTVVLLPLVKLSELLSRSLRREKASATATSVEEIRLLARLGRREGIFGARTADMIVGATRLSQLRAHDVMVPRQRVTFLSGARSKAENLEVVRKSRHSRLPFSATDDLDAVSGIVLAKELFFQLEKRPEQEIDWEALMHEPLIVPKGKPLNSLMKAFQENRRHMAIVVDEYGGVEGIVTLEDVLEEIVGEIIDESDTYVEEMWPQADGSLEVLASIEMRKVGEHLGFEWFSDADITSAGGLVTELLGRIPVKSDAVEWNGYRLEVLSATQRRAERIRIRPVATQATLTPEAAGE